MTRIKIVKACASQSVADTAKEYPGAVSVSASFHWLVIIFLKYEDASMRCFDDSFIRISEGFGTLSFAAPVETFAGVLDWTVESDGGFGIVKSVPLSGSRPAVGDR